MRLFPFPNNPYGPFSASDGNRFVNPGARSRTAFCTTIFTPFDLSMVANSPPPDVQGTIFPETAMIRDATMFLQWRFAAARTIGTDDDEMRVAERIVLW